MAGSPLMEQSCALPDAASLALLVAEAEVNRLVAKYASCNDWLDWPGMRALFTDDATIDFGAMFRGTPDTFMPFVATLEEGYDRRMHMFGLPRIVIDGAAARVDLCSIIHTRTKGTEQHTDVIFHGRYLFTARRTDAGWLLDGLHYLLNALDVVHPPAAEEGPVNLADDFGPAHPLMPRD